MADIVIEVHDDSVLFGIDRQCMDLRQSMNGSMENGRKTALSKKDNDD